MEIKSIKVNNFKSLVDFETPLAKFSCLVGLNGAGKSTVLQFFDFLSQQVKGDLSGWLKKRQWKASDLNSKLTNKNNIAFEIILSAQDSSSQPIEIKWSGSFNRQALRCTAERIEWGDRLLLKVDDGNYHIWDLERQSQELPKDRESDVSYVVYQEKHKSLMSGNNIFKYEGSLLSLIDNSQLPSRLRRMKDFFGNLHALDLLAPELLRQRTRDAGNSLGIGGERLSAFLYEIGDEKRASIQTELSKIYPQLRQLNLLSLRSGWKELAVQEQFEDVTIKTEARHVADGFLRMLAVFAQLSKHQGFLLLDEIENGINPELIESLVDQLVEASTQVLVTTHSPMVLNYLHDHIAVEGVIYLYKNKAGATQAIKLFDIPSMREKLTVMGAGEVYEDTHLAQLNKEILGEH
jgi:predicted ATPase